MSEYEKTISEYPNIDFTYSSPSKDKSLFLLEAPNILPQNYITDHVKQYKKVYTWNGKLAEEYKQIGIDAVKIPNFPLFDNYYTLDSYIPFEDRINGVCLICRYRGKQSHYFDISYKRIEVFEEIEGIEKHCYGKLEYCGDHYKGVIGKGQGTFPSSMAKLKKLNEYKFNLCFENCYHELWSWDYITEKITDCFKAKTIPIYLGCYNIEERIPKELYIDFREFDSTEKLVSHLNTINKDQFEDMTEKAFEWEKENKLGNIEELKGILDND